MSNEIKYIIKPEEKMVIGIYVLREPELLAENSNLTVTEKGILREIVLFNDRINGIFDTKIKAVAKCHGNDVFNEEYGKKLVEAKISKKRHEIVLKNIKIVMEITKDFQSKMCLLYTKHNRKMEHITKDLREYFGLEGDQD